MRTFCLYLALLLGIGLIGVFVVELWLRTLGWSYADLIEDRTRFCFAASSVLTPFLVAFRAGWREWNAPYFIAACGAVGAIYGGSVGTTLAAVLVGAPTYAVIREVHRMITMKNPQGSWSAGPEPIPLNPDEFEDHHAASDQIDHIEDYIDVGIYPVSEAKKLIRRMEAQHIDFYVEAPHVDPAGGDVYAAAHGGSYGSTPQTILYVHHQQLDAFDAIQAELHEHETEASDGASLLEMFRGFAVNHDLDHTIDQDQQNRDNKGHGA